MAKMKVNKDAKKAAEQKKAIKLINWIKREMARESRIQKSASHTISLYTNTPQSGWDPRLTPAIVAEIKKSSELSWEKASGAWLAYAYCIERLKKDFDV